LAHYKNSIEILLIVVNQEKLAPVKVQGKTDKRAIKNGPPQH
jgi:hypothetical protein